jgi:lantibiotic modifying enzyme
MPTYYTSFDDLHIVMDSYKSDTDQILAENKTQALGHKIPTFSIIDSFTPDLDEVLFPYLIAESKSTCFSLFKSGVDQKIEQAARRQKSYMQSDMYRVKKENKRPYYGRR